MGSKRYNNLADPSYNGGDLEITYRNPKCGAQLIVKPSRLKRWLEKLDKPLVGTSFDGVSRCL